MAQNTVYKWPVVNLQAVCKTQDADEGYNLILDGTMSVAGASQISFIRAGFSRSISISSDQNLSAVRFTVTGIQNGAGIIKNNIIGPDNGTVYVDEIFDVITSVTVSVGNAVNVQVGTGKQGFLPLLNVDPAFSRFNIRHTNGSYALSARVPEDTIIFDIYTTLENIDDNGIPLENQLDHFFPVGAITNRQTSILYQNNELANYLLLYVKDTLVPETGSLEFIYMQS